MKEFLEQIWQNHLQFLDFNSHFKDKNALDVSELAILLSANKDNYERYFLLKEFGAIFKKIALRVDIFSIQEAQIRTINLLKKGLLDKKELIKALVILDKITNTAFVRGYLEQLQTPQIDQKSLLQASFKELDGINLELINLCESEERKKRLEKSLNKFKNLHFSIAITGVMNAGKSSLLNALLKKPILGVSNVPETANLTLLKYGKSKGAKIYFWDESEWRDILSNSYFNEDLSRFIRELGAEFDLSAYIKPEALMQEIPLDELQSFSSAQNKISALIKKIELEGELEFLQNNIAIVDTPGLDDIVVQREILTREYLKESDFLIHLMNASQSLTQKDAEFLISCLLNSRLSKFLIVLTKADLLGDEDLNEVINYTKNTLKSRLGDLQSLAEQIDFLPVSAKKANAFYAGEADESALEESKIPQFEAYLLNALYSGEKSKTALSAYKKELGLELGRLLEFYALQRKLLTERGHEKSGENEDLLARMQVWQEKFEQAKKDICDSIERLQGLENGVDRRILLLAKKLKERLIDELKYLQNHRKKLNLERILNIIELTTRDGISDILREVNFENFKQMESIKDALSIKYDFLQAEFNSDFESFKSGISKGIEAIFAADKFAKLKSKITQILKEKDDIFSLETRLFELIDEGFRGFGLEEVLKNLKINESFFNFLNEKLTAYQQSSQEKINELSALLEGVEGENLKLNAMRQETEAKIQKLHALKEMLDAN
ncbi:dynamin family protein [Campylobacter sp.]|uniref:dynamin family protein n=1 Tax=Campylobacter sp. TaxID=205 RepID=UPI0026DAAACB|nr:dynamin family protein [Campylobacter sp.]MDO4673614.1 dynamin family protein [Campylobacter sp.]